MKVVVQFILVGCFVLFVCLGCNVSYVKAGNQSNIDLDQKNEPKTELDMVVDPNIVKRPIPTVNKNCSMPSIPTDYVKDVYSSGDSTIEYTLTDGYLYKAMEIQFFGKRGDVKRKNCIVPLNATKSKITLPDYAKIDPPQRWFNFVILTQEGCEVWGSVNETVISKRSGNIITIDSPTPSEGAAFLLNKF